MVQCVRDHGHFAHLLSSNNIKLLLLEDWKYLYTSFSEICTNLLTARFWMAVGLKAFFSVVREGFVSWKWWCVENQNRWPIMHFDICLHWMDVWVLSRRTTIEVAKCSQTHLSKWNTSELRLSNTLEMDNIWVGTLRLADMNSTYVCIDRSQTQTCAAPQTCIM